MEGSHNTLAIPLNLWTALQAEMRKWGEAPRGDEWDEERVRIEVSNLSERFSKMVCCNFAAGLTPLGYPVSVAEIALWPLIDARERSGDLREADYLEAKQQAVAASERVVSHLAQSQALAFPFRAEVFEAGLFFHRSGHNDYSRNAARMFTAACELITTGTIWLPPYGSAKTSMALPAGIALTDDHETILAVLAKTPTKCKAVVDIASGGKIGNRETVGRLMTELARGGLVERPYGKRKGYAITDAGRKRLPGASPT